jgi:hypothetical protein
MGFVIVIIIIIIIIITVTAIHWAHLLLQTRNVCKIYWKTAVETWAYVGDNITVDLRGVSYEAVDGTPPTHNWV